MADVRIKDLAVTATTTTSDDYLAIDGTTNNTRKVSAYSPTFSGGLNSTPIGASTPSTGAFTTLTSSSTTTLNGTTIPASSTLLVSGGALGTPSSGTVTNLTGTASININGTVGATTPSTGAFTTLSASTSVTTPSLTNAGTLALSATGANVLTASTNGSERLRIDASGNVLIGTTTDSANGRLQLTSHTTSAGGIGFGTDVSLYRSGTYTLNLAGYLVAVSPEDYGSGLAVKSNNNAGSWARMDFVNVNADGTALLYQNQAGQFEIRNDSTNSVIAFVTKGGVERMRVNGNGNVGIGTTSPGQKLQVNGDIKIRAATAGTIRWSNDDSQTFAFAQYDDSTGKMSLGTASGRSYETEIHYNGAVHFSASAGGLKVASGKDLQLGNAYVAGAPTATGYVTIQDSTGTFYKIPAVAV